MATTHEPNHEHQLDPEHEQHSAPQMRSPQPKKPQPGKRALTKEQENYANQLAIKQRNQQLYRQSHHPNWTHQPRQTQKTAQKVMRTMRQLSRDPEFGALAVQMLRNRGITNLKQLSRPQLKQVMVDLRTLQRDIAQHTEQKNPLNGPDLTNPTVAQRMLELNPAMNPMFQQQMAEQEGALEDSQNIQQATLLDEEHQQEEELAAENEQASNEATQSDSHDMRDELVTHAAAEALVESEPLAQQVESVLKVMNPTPKFSEAKDVLEDMFESSKSNSMGMSPST